MRGRASLRRVWAVRAEDLAKSRWQLLATCSRRRLARLARPRAACRGAAGWPCRGWRGRYEGDGREGGASRVRGGAVRAAGGKEARQRHLLHEATRHPGRARPCRCPAGRGRPAGANAGRSAGRAATEFGLLPNLKRGGRGMSRHVSWHWPLGPQLTVLMRYLRMRTRARPARPAGRPIRIIEGGTWLQG